MARTATRTEEELDLSMLINLLSDAYTASYRGSSLKVRRRYRRLIVALQKRRAQELQSAGNATESSTRTTSCAPPAGS